MKIISPYAAVIGGIIHRSLVMSRTSFHKNGIWFSLLFIFFSLASLLMSRYIGMDGLRMIVSVAMGVTIMVLMMWVMRSEKNGFWLICHSIVFAAFIALCWSEHF